MTPKTLAIIACTAAMTIGAGAAGAQRLVKGTQDGHGATVPPKELAIPAVWRHMPVPFALIPANPLPKQTIAEATNADDYAKVAEYFHYQELVFRARARNTIDWYATHPRKYPMATKTVTRAETIERQYHEYLSKAQKSARLAADYDEMLEELGSKPREISKEVVSVKDLEETWSGVLGN